MKNAPMPASVLESINPTTAEEWLKTMRRNRPLNSGRVIEYALQMDAGTWVLNGESIKFDDDGALFDGQHRLHACILARKPFATYVVRGIKDRRAFTTVDVGSPRTHSNMFAMQDYGDYAHASTAAGLIYQYKKNIITIKGPRPERAEREKALTRGTRFARAGGGIRVTDKESLVAFAESIRDELIRSLNAARRHAPPKLIPVPTLAAAHFLFAEKSKYDADQFVADLKSGAGLAAHDPVHRLRERLISVVASKTRLTRYAIFAYVIKAWNKRRAGETVSALRLVDNEPFPKVK